MADVLLQVVPRVADAAGVTYSARVRGRMAEDGRWEAAIEFEPLGGGETLRSPRETVQHDRADLEYWASGLTASYLEGALERARDAQLPEAAAPAVADPIAARVAGVGEPAGAPSPARHRQPKAVLDPFAVLAQGEEVLREELGALDEGHLRDIIRAYALVDESVQDLRAARATLVETIVSAVRQR